MNSMQQAVLKTLVYADLFDYPLTREELHRFLITSHPITKNKLPQKKYFYLPGRRYLISLRRSRLHFSQLKWSASRRIANFLKFIPTIKLIAVSGALAMNNSDQHADIDLMIITSKNRLWLTRLVVVLLLELFCLRRRPKTHPRGVSNKICLNLLLDETALTLPVSQRNLFTAHEICQLKPLFDRDQSYQKFITANLWVKQYLANWKN